MKAVNFKIQNAIFKFNQKEVKEQIIQKRSAYASGETDKLLNLITTGDQETIVIPEEPVFFDYTALDLIAEYWTRHCRLFKAVSDAIIVLLPD